MYSQDILDFSQYKTQSLPADADSSILLFKLLTILQSWDFSTSTDFSSFFESLESRLSLSNSSLDSLDSQLSSALSSLSSIVSILNSLPSFSSLDSLDSINSYSFSIDSKFTSLSSLLSTLDSRLSSVLPSIDSRLVTTNSSLSNLISLSNDLKTLLTQSKLNTTNTFPHFLFLPLPAFPNVLYVSFPRSTTAFSFSSVGELTSPDSFNSAARYHLSLPDDPNYAIDPLPSDPCPCLLSSDQVSAWYPLFLGTEESQAHLSLPSSLLLRLTHFGSSSLNLCLKSWSRDFSPPSFSLSS